MLPDSSAPDLAAQPLRFLNAYWTLWQALAQPVDSALVRLHDLDLRAFIALSYVQGGMTSPGELSVTMSIPKYEVSRTLDRLTKLGAITRRSDPANARRRTLGVTPSGQALWASALATVQAVTQPPLEALGPLEALTLGLEQLAAHAQRCTVQHLTPHPSPTSPEQP
ncbi:winged helix-turn-helix transcriptional regulator [Deinococcus detaillensis]|uniref:Winged helix-turn-helix transcriptional regulator n=1 Tax=Deinococcus detaillensis TaxID=2592048 RepID=A0A553V4S4_9DEIO|nr:MarR family winged helix-turn-helix transcriptional regulator [Deinococcus detaillensis]TSA87488.1 winged helix-turn-helix transcriptional regulator [Deinococcus detaillensis]